MPEEISPQKFQNVVHQGFNRMKHYRKMRALFVKEYVGQYYRSKGVTLSGDEPINLIFQAIRTIVPNLAVTNPVNSVSTRFLPQKPYAELLSLALNQIQEDMKLKDIIRACIVDAMFGFGILKTGIAASGELLQFGDNLIDPGQVYTELIDLDDFVFDPVCTSMRKSAFMGHRVTIPKQILLDTKGYNHDLIKKIPRLGYPQEKIERLTKDKGMSYDMESLQDLINVVELWVPEAEAVVTIPDPLQITFTEHLRIADYYGPKEGPYTILSFTPPVPGNPFPVAPVGMLFDLHRGANKAFKKIMDQAGRQRDITFYTPAAADEAEALRESQDGDLIATMNPNEVKTVSFGGQNKDNALYLQQMQIWFNYFAGNPDQMAGNMTPGTKGGKTTATQSQIMQGNASIGIEDGRGILYDKTSDVSKKHAWYLHTDPMIELPLIKRRSGGEQIQLWLTPEQRSGDFLHFTFKIRQRSMTRLNPDVRAKRIVEFGTNLVPALINAGMVAVQSGMQFNVTRAVTQLAEQLDILEDVQDWFDDPEFEQKMMMMMQKGPQNAGKASMSPEGTLQNGGFPQQTNIPTSGQIFNQEAQATAAEGQKVNQGAY